MHVRFSRIRHMKEACRRAPAENLKQQAECRTCGWLQMCFFLSCASALQEPESTHLRWSAFPVALWSFYICCTSGFFFKLLMADCSGCALVTVDQRG